MSHSYIDLTIISAQDLKSVTFFGKNQPFVVAFLHPSSQRRTKVAVDGGRNPLWKEKLELPLDDSFLQSRNPVVTIKVYSQGGFGGDQVIGSAHIPLSQISKDGARTMSTYQLRRPSGRAKGIISVIATMVGGSLSQAYTLSPPIKVGVPPPPANDPTTRQDSAYPPMKHSDENPAMAYPAYGFHYNSDESYRQSYPPNSYVPNSGSSNPPPPNNYSYNYPYQSPYPPPYQSGYPPPMYPPVVPPQPPRKNRFGSGGGLGLGAGLLGGAVGGLLLGDLIGDMSYGGGGYDQGFDSGMGDSVGDMSYDDQGFDSGMGDDWGDGGF